MASRLYDPEIRRALRTLNRIPGVATRSSCQGRFSREERSTHADLAYVILRHPLPVAFEDHLIDRLGTLARVDPRSVYSAWPERNALFCRSLEEAAVDFAEVAERWRHRPIPIIDVLAAVERALAADDEVAVGWCFHCELLVDPLRHRAECDVVPLAAGGPDTRLEVFAAFLAADPRPPDPSLREREGDAAVLGRVERGDFGDRYRDQWARARSIAARRMLEEDAREGIRALRARGVPADLFFHAAKIVFAIERRAEPGRLD